MKNQINELRKIVNQFYAITDKMRLQLDLIESRNNESAVIKNGTDCNVEKYEFKELK